MSGSAKNYRRDRVAISADVQAETDRLLGGHVRDIRLTGELRRLYLDVSFRQRSKIVRAWAVWLIFIGAIFVPLSQLGSPADNLPALAAYLILCPIVNTWVYIVWNKQRNLRIQQLSVIVMIVVTTVAFDVIGATAGDRTTVLYATGMICIAYIAIMVLSIEYAWTLTLAATALVILWISVFLDPAINTKTALSVCLFYTVGMVAVVKARHTSTILAHHSFLMSLRDDYRREALTEANRQLEMLAMRDPLTSLANRRSASADIDALWNDGVTPKGNIAFVMADIDHFKKLNDTAGHAAGDDCLALVARRIESSVRSGIDIVCRHGGEEFLIVLAGVSHEQAWTFAERIRSGVEALAIVNPGIARDGQPGVVTISLGLAFAEGDARPELVTSWADAALYDAKHGGRNRVFMSMDRMLAPVPVPAAPAVVAV